MEEYKRVAETSERIKEALKISGKKQVDLARETGIDKGSISNYISGRYEPKLPAVKKLANSLNVDEMWLWGFDVPRNPVTLIGKKIHERREEIGLTQEELAARMGYESVSAIARIEKGLSDVTQSTLMKFAEVLNTTPSFLMGWEDEHNRNSAIVPLISILREDDTFLNLTDVFYQKRDKLAPLVTMMCADANFFEMVWDLANLDDDKRASIGALLAAFKQK